MPNRNYIKGTRFERELVNQARDEGKIAFRSAGSHSTFDVVVIDLSKRTIDFSQCKTGNALTGNKLITMEKEFQKHNGYFDVRFLVKVRPAKMKGGNNAKQQNK